MSECEREGCPAEGWSYQRYGSTVQSPAVGFNYSTTGPAPEQPITLCTEHAIESFGWARTR